MHEKNSKPLQKEAPLCIIDRELKPLFKGL